MKIDYTIDENDYLAYQLFLASKSERVRKKRQQTKIIMPILFAVSCFLLLFLGQAWLAILFFGIGILWFFIYPHWERGHYIKFYKAFIKENYKAKLGSIVTIEFSDDHILVKDYQSETKVLTSEVEDIFEIPSTIFVRLKGGQSIILPKDKIADLDNLKARLKELANHLKIKYDTDEKWEWK